MVRPQRVLYVHPWGHVNELVVPAGAISCMNAIPGPKLGRFAFELDDREIRGAVAVCTDLHWGTALPGFERLVRHVRTVAPEVPIIAGGITAAHFAEELVTTLPVDYVLRGDSEVSFAALVAALRAGERPARLANVHAPGEPAPVRRRMTRSEFDGTDPVSIDWFPTFAGVTDLEAVAYSPGRTIPVARGCPLRCPACYGCHASTYGDGYLWRSPSSAAALVRNASTAAARNPLLFVGKPSPRELSNLLAGLAATGPFRFGGTVAFYLCRAPADADLELIEKAFDSPVVLSVVPPEDHTPALPPERLAQERTAWERVSAHVAESKTLRLEMYASEATAGELRARLATGSPERVGVTCSAAWPVARPGDGATTTLARLSEAVDRFWTFYAALLLSPPLALLLQPFRCLDGVDDGIDLIAPPEDRCLVPFHESIMRTWLAYRLPQIPELAFRAVPVTLSSRPLQGHRGRARFRGDLGVVPPRTCLRAGPSSSFSERTDHHGVSLEAVIPALPALCDGLAIVPAARAAHEFEAFGRYDLAVLRTPSGSAAGPFRLRIDVRVQDARLSLLDGAGEVVRRGVADLPYFRTADSSDGRLAHLR